MRGGVGTFAVVAVVVVALGRLCAADMNVMFPHWADHLNPGERYYTFLHKQNAQQKYAFDLSVRKKSNGVWRSTKPGSPAQKSNSDYYIYGKPAYAMASGVVVACWRNAYENLSPPAKTEYQAVKSRMNVGGNHIIVETPSGDRWKISHLQPGTLPSSLCPNNWVLYPFNRDGTVNTSARWIPEGSRPTITKGQYIGRVGNSGNSSGPHTHMHAVDTANKAIHFRFDRGLASKWNGGSPDINDWTSFSGGDIPLEIDDDLRVLIWPPRRLRQEYARHGFRSSDYQRMFEHLVNSGYMPKWMDIYQVGNTLYRNFVFVPAAGSFRSYSMMTRTKHLQRLEEAKDDGYEPVQLEVHKRFSSARYAVIYQRNVPGSWDLRTNRLWGAHVALKNTNSANGMTPVSLSVVVVGGVRRYSTLWRSEDYGTHVMYEHVRQSQYQAVYDVQKSLGRYPISLNGYVYNGISYFAVVFAEKPKGTIIATHGATGASYQNTYNYARSRSHLTEVVTGNDGANSHRFAGIWRKATFDFTPPGGFVTAA